MVLIDEVHLLNYKDHGMCWRLNSMNDEGFEERDSMYVVPMNNV